MNSAKLNIDCSPEELKAWKKTAIDAGIPLASWVRARLNSDGGGGQLSILSPPDKPLSGYQKFWEEDGWKQKVETSANLNQEEQQKP